MVLILAREPGVKFFIYLLSGWNHVRAITLPFVGSIWSPEKTLLDLFPRCQIKSCGSDEKHRRVWKELISFAIPGLDTFCALVITVAGFHGEHGSDRCMMVTILTKNFDVVHARSIVEYVRMTEYIK